MSSRRIILKGDEAELSAVSDAAWQLVVMPQQVLLISKLLKKR